MIAGPAAVDCARKLSEDHWLDLGVFHPDGDEVRAKLAGHGVLEGRPNI